MVIAERPSDPAETFLVRLAQALHRAGSPVGRLEGVLEATARRLGVEGRFLATPTALLLAFGPVEASRTVLLRLPPGEPDLAAWSRAEGLARSAGAATDLQQACAELDTLLQPVPRRRPGTPVLAAAGACAAAARLLGGTGWDLALAALGGAATVLGGALLARRPAAASLLPLLLAFLLSAAAHALAAVLPLRPVLAVLGGLILWVPGLGLTTGLHEIAAGHLVAGAARLTHAGVVFLELAFGLALGARLRPEGAAAPEPLPPGPAATALAVAVLALGLVPLFRTPPRGVLPLLAGAACAFLGARLGGAWLGPELGSFAGAFLVVLLAPLLTRRAGLPEAVAELPGILLLVPGSLGFLALASLLESEPLAGLDAAWRTALTGISIASGLLLGHALRGAARAPAPGTAGGPAGRMPA